MRKIIVVMCLVFAWGSTVLVQDNSRASDGEPIYRIEILQAVRSDEAFMGDISLAPSDDAHVVLIVKVNFYKNGKLLYANHTGGLSLTTQLLLLASDSKKYRPDANYSVELGNEANITIYFNVPKNSGGLMLQYRDSKPLPLAIQAPRNGKM